MEVPFGQRQRLGHCRRCASRLIHTVESVRDGDHAILARRCADCEFRETVVVSTPHAARLSLAEHRVRAQMLVLADSLREVSVGDPRP